MKHSALPALLLCLLLAGPLRAADQDVVINELQYNPASDNSLDEFIELYNHGASAMDLSGWTLSNALDFTFPPGTTIAAGGFLCVSPDTATFTATYGAAAVVGPYTGKLDNGGESVWLNNASGTQVDKVAYDDAGGWPVAADGTGPSLELVSPTLDNSLPESWQASSVPGGTPGFPNSPGAAPPPDIFDDTTVLEFRLTFHQADWWDQLTANAAAETYIPCDFTFGGTTWTNIGARFKGNSSQNLPPGTLKKPFKLNFNEYVSGQSFYGHDNINLGNSFKDPTMMREKIVSDMLRPYIAVPRMNHVNVYINDQLWGLYVNVEEVDRDFLSGQYQEDGGNLYKGDPAGDLTYKGATQDLYTSSYSLETNTTTNDWSDLVHFIDILNNTTAATLETSLTTTLDVDNALRYLAYQNAFSSLDSYLGSGHNYYIYYQNHGNQFRMIPWDMNEAFGTFTMGLSSTQLVNLSLTYGTSTNRPLTRRLLLDVPAWRTQYNAILQEFIDGPFQESLVRTRIQTLDGLIRTSVQADPNKLYTYDQYLANQESDVVMSGTGPGGTAIGLTRFVRDRRASIVTQLAGGTTNSIPVINEVMYRAGSSSTLEYVELYNPSGTTMSLDGWSLARRATTGQTPWAIPAGTTIGAYGYVVLTNNLALFQGSYGTSVSAVGNVPFTFSNTGDEVTLLIAGQPPQDTLTYATTSPWPTAANGGGPSMELKNPSLDNAVGSHWAASGQLSGKWGSPGARNTVTATPAGSAWFVR